MLLGWLRKIRQLCLKFRCVLLTVDNVASQTKEAGHKSLVNSFLSKPTRHICCHQYCFIQLFFPYSKALPRTCSKTLMCEIGSPWRLATCWHMHCGARVFWFSRRCSITFSRQSCWSFPYCFPFADASCHVGALSSITTRSHFAETGFL